MQTRELLNKLDELKRLAETEKGLEAQIEIARQLQELSNHWTDKVGRELELVA